ncbi:MT-A70 family methyltransferase [uncultured Gordonia sp.]|uniref:MT-A70 family methyltransferase n=1 Tax=uncultured Gordonia sp. TaxID=198437 RepID=UPI0025854E2C|nr:MT-A70 family methyltransferase [uncultured Gordonia sp.]
MTEALSDPTNLNIERLVHIDRRIDENESDALRARWEFGHQMLAARDGAGRLPNGYLAQLVERTEKSRAELKFRAQFAATYPTEEQLANALASCESWASTIRSLKKSRDAADNTPQDPPAIPEGKFATFVADPPWQYGNTSTRGAAEKHYGTMTIPELCDLSVVPDHAADEAHLYLWVTAGHLPEGFKVMEAWGFEYKTYLVWVKPQMGMGNYFRVSTELVLFGVRGGMRTQRRDVKNYFEAKRGKHSAKPPQFHDMVSTCSPGPYMELFSRCSASEMLTGCQCSKCRLGWTVWGNQS